MALYCGIDLHSTNCWISIINEERKLVWESKVTNDLSEVLSSLEPFREEVVGIAVESTFNWYWLVDGLAEAGYEVHLTNTWAAKQYEGLKYADDRHDARWLAHMLSLGILPEGYVYPKAERGVRDLLRRRGFIVNKRTAFILSMRGSVACHTGENINSNEIRKWTETEIEALIEDPFAALGVSCLLHPVAAMDEEIKKIEKLVTVRARLRDEFAPLLSVWGIGRILSLTIMYEVGEIDRFKKVGNYASYCRCVKSDWWSNGKRKGSGNARNGNPYLSWAYSEAAHFAVRYQPRARQFYQRKKSKTNGIVAIRALAHKLARASYYVMKDQVPFDPDKVFA